MWSANQFRCFRGSSDDFLGSARVSRAGFGVAPKQAFLPREAIWLRGANKKFATARTRSPARETRALPRPPRSRDSLRAFFERGRLTTQVRQNFASEMQRAGDQDRILLLTCKHQCVANG
jgi:hypothetical protein